MKKWIVFLVISLCFNLGAQTPFFSWAKSFAGSGDDTPYALYVDATGNVYTTGYFNGTVDFDPGPGVYTLTSQGGQDVFFSKMSASGNLIWAKKIGGSGAEKGLAIKVDPSGNVYLSGWFTATADFDPGLGISNLSSNGNTDIFIAKYNGTGDFLWAHSFGDIGLDVACSLDLDNLGNIYSTGIYMATVDFDPGPASFSITSRDSSEDVFVLKLSNSGNFIWVKSFGGISIDRATGISLDVTGNILIGGYDYGNCDFDPGPGTYTLPTSNPASDPFVCKLNNSGNFIWAKKFTCINYDYSAAISVDRSNNVYSTGSFNGTMDFDPGPASYTLTSPGSDRAYVAKLDSNGNFVWAKDLGGNSMGSGITLDMNKNVYSTGSFYGPADFDPSAGTYTIAGGGNGDIYISKLDSSGNFKWAIGMGGPSGDGGRSVFVDNNDDIYTTGGFTDSVDFDPGIGISKLFSTGSFDVFIHKLSQGFVGVKELADVSEAISIYPNPTMGKISIEVDKIETHKLSLISIDGMELEVPQNEKEFDLSNLSNGVYFLRYSTETSQKTFMIIKN